MTPCASDLSGDRVFESARLYARRWRRDDLPMILDVYGDARVARFVGDGIPITAEQAARWLDVTANNYRVRGYGMYALQRRDTGALIGFCGLVHPGGQPEPEFKYALLPDLWGQGYAPEAVTALLDYGARHLGLKDVIATVDPDNRASQRVMAKVGAVCTEHRVNDDDSVTWVYTWRAPRCDLTGMRGADA